jgi:hypothetical protein
MGRANTRNRLTAKSAEPGPAGPDPFKRRSPVQYVDPLVHVIREGVRCDTEKRGHPTSRGLSPLEIVVDASEGFIPLWAKGTTLRWRFQEASMQSFENPDAAKASIEKLLGEALLAWGDAVPIKFAKRDDAWDFEIEVKEADDCNVSGCVLASAFFPDAGRHKLFVYPRMFTQDQQEQIETLAHEIGHVFGLRHFFAQVSETAFPSEIFGTHNKFSIMNYGNDSKLSPEDRADLKKLYETAWAGQLTKINGTPIKFVKPFHAIGEPAENVVAVGQIQATG